MAGSRSRQTPKQGERVLVQELPASFQTRLTQGGVYTEITDSTTGAAVEVPTSSMQIARTVLTAFLPQGGAARGVEPQETPKSEPVSAPQPETAPEPEKVTAPAEVPAASKPAAKPKAASKSGAKTTPKAETSKPSGAKSTTKPAAEATPAVDTFSDEPWFAELPDGLEAGPRIVLRKVRVAVDEKKQDKVIGLAVENPNNPSLPAYAVNIKGTKSSPGGELGVGFVLAVSETKFLIVAPQLGPKTSHRGIKPTAQRLEILLETTSDQALKAA